MYMDPCDTIQDKSFLVYLTITDLEKMGDQDWAEVCRFYYSVCTALWMATSFYCLNQLCLDFGRVPNFHPSLDSRKNFFVKNVSITPSDKNRSVIRPFVRGPWTMQHLVAQKTPEI